MDIFNRLTALLSGNSAVESGIIAASAAFIIFFLTRATEIVVIMLNKRATRKRLVIGLYQEVKYNVALLEGPTSDPEIVKEKVKKELNFRPLIVREESTQFYDAITALLPDISAPCLIAVIKFYVKLRRQQRIAAAFEGLAFMTISPAGRAGLVDDLWECCREAKEDGRTAVYEFERAYPRSWFNAFKSSP